MPKSTGKLRQWFVAHHDKKDKWVAAEDTGDYTCRNHPLIKQGYSIHGNCAFVTAVEAIDYIRQIKEM